jgi:hypothetical protein
MTPLEIGAIAVPVVSILGAAGAIWNDRRKGRLSTSEHQRIYIDDQQADINALRRDLAVLWTWAVKQIRKAAAAGIELDPLPSEPPQSKQPHNRDESL